MNPLRRAMQWLAGCAVVLSSSGALADSLPPELLDALVDTANEAFADCRLADSREAWLQIYRLGSPRIAACNIGELSLRIGDVVLAAEYLSICVREIPRDSPYRDKDKVHVQSYARVRRAVGALTIVAPEGSSIDVDGTPAGRAPLDKEVFVRPGPHRIRAESSGVAHEITVDIRPGDARPVVVVSWPILPRIAPPSRKATSPLAAIVLVLAACGSLVLGFQLTNRRPPTSHDTTG